MGYFVFFIMVVSQCFCNAPFHCDLDGSKPVPYAPAALNETERDEDCVPLVSPPGGLVISLSASGLAGMTAATAEREYLFQVISEEKPDLFRQRHINIEVGEEHAYAGASSLWVIMHNSSLSLLQEEGPCRF
jgi:hypothetical protein